MLIVLARPLKITWPMLARMHYTLRPKALRVCDGVCVCASISVGVIVFGLCLCVPAGVLRLWASASLGRWGSEALRLWGS
eukprot:1385783-Alexandrium_andersonii.AAC.1